MRYFFSLIIALVLSLSACAQAGAVIDANQAQVLLNSPNPALLIDVRTAEEYQSGHIAGATLLPYDQIDQSSVAALAGDKNTPIIVYCRSGRRSAIAAQTLQKLGYLQVYDLGSISQWPFPLLEQ